MELINWVKTALSSEIEYSKALKSQPVEYPRFIHMYNPFVPWSGDFNRALGLKITDFQSFEEISAQIKNIHQEKALENPDRFDIYPPVLEEGQWQDYLLNRGYSLSTAIFFSAPTLDCNLPSEFKLETPPENQYIEWFCDVVRSRGYFEEKWFEKVKPLQLNFCRTFRPYWLWKGDNRVGWVYCAHLESYARLFEVEICEAYRGQGMGKLLLQAIRAEGYKKGAKYILLQSGESLRPFYESAGFQECTRNSIVWSKS